MRHVLLVEPYCRRTVDPSKPPPCVKLDPTPEEVRDAAELKADVSVLSARLLLLAPRDVSDASMTFVSNRGYYMECDDPKLLQGNARHCLVASADLVDALRGSEAYPGLVWRVRSRFLRRWRVLRPQIRERVRRLRKLDPPLPF